MDVEAFLSSLTADEAYRGQAVHVEVLPERPARYGELPPGLIEPRLAAALNAIGISRLYSHQADAITAAMSGRCVVVVTGTASGKTLCYTIPVLDTILKDALATALFIYPTKALAQDQLRGLTRFGEALTSPDLPAARKGSGVFLAGTYDGDTPTTERRKLRDRGSVILTNPDMLHQGILPQHARWNRFFANLKYVVLDEVHSYRGVFGSHLANVLRRMKRICRHYGSNPQFICCSATIANPKAHAESITGTEMVLIDDDGSPRGPRRFVFWNPPLLGLGPGHDVPAQQSNVPARQWDVRPQQWDVPPQQSNLPAQQCDVPAQQSIIPVQPTAGGERRSPLWEAVGLLTSLVKGGVQTIAFTRTRLMAELILRCAREYLDAISPRLARSVEAYRSGYLPEERRGIERKLANGETLAVASTNALELGIDIGSLDAAILVGYPGTIASTWQQAGRAGRKSGESVVFLIGDNSPIDQYMMAHTGYLFARSPEQAVIDPDNPHIAIGHIKSAAYEMALSDAEASIFGEYALPLLEILEDEGSVRHIEQHWYWASSEYPAAEVNLRNICGPVYTIQDSSQGNRVIGTMDEVCALSQLHTHAVYLHGADTYFVEALDLDQKIAYVSKRDLDYYTQAVQTSRIRIDEVEYEKPWRGGTVGFGDVTVTTSTPMFKKIRFHSRDSLGYEELEMPPQTLETVSLWIAPPESAVEAVRAEGRVFAEGLIGIANAMVECAPLYVMCDVRDIGVVVDSSNLRKDALFLFDRYPGGMGYAQRCADCIEALIRAVYEVVSRCSCASGCPSCVGSAMPAFAMSDLDSGARGRIPDKRGALAILRALLA